jgi:hypothetical protein
MSAAPTGTDAMATLPAHIAQPPESFAQSVVKPATIIAAKKVIIGAMNPPTTAPNSAIPMIEKMLRRAGGVFSPSVGGVVMIGAAWSSVFSPQC